LSAFDEPLALVVGEAESPHRERHAHDAAAQRHAVLAIVLGTLLLRDGYELLLQLSGFFVVLGEFIDLAGELLQPVLQDVIRDFFFVEGDHFLDGAHALFQVVAHREKFVNDDRRARESFEHAQLPPLNALGDFNFALARKQRHSPHFPQIHADGVVGFFQCAGG